MRRSLGVPPRGGYWGDYVTRDAFAVAPRARLPAPGLSPRRPRRHPPPKRLTFMAGATALGDHSEEWLSWFKAPDLKSDVGASSPWVRIPPPPPISRAAAARGCLRARRRRVLAVRVARETGAEGVDAAIERLHRAPRESLQDLPIEAKHLGPRAPAGSEDLGGLEVPGEGL